MRWKKLSVVLAVIISLSGIGSVTYKFVIKVDTAFAFIEKTDRRHVQEDLIFLERREFSLQEKRNMGLWTPRDVDELIRLQNQIDELKRELGYL